MVIERMVGLFRADERQNDERGWAYNLAIFRVVFLLGAVLPLALATLSWTIHQLPYLPRDAWRPVSFYQLLPVQVMANSTVAQVLAVVNLGLIGLGAVGFCTRYVLGAAAVISLYSFGLMENQGKVDHFHHVVWFLALLAVGPSGRFLSVDAVWSAVRNADRGRVDATVTRGGALQTLRFIWVLLGLVYLTPGLSKLEAAVTNGWATAESLRGVLWLKWFELYLYKPDFALPARVDLLPFPLLTLGGISVILFEVGFILLVMFRPTRILLAVAGLGFHVGNGLVLYIQFLSLMVAYSCLFDWSAFGRSAYRQLGIRPLTVLYDGGCQLCRRTIGILRSLDVCDQLVPIAGLSEDRGKEHAEITDEMLLRDMYTVSGDRIAKGFDAYVQIAGRIPILWPLALLMRCPPIPTFGRIVYRRIADSRRCALPDHRPQPAPIVASDTRPIYYVGVLLIVGQLGISMWQFTAEHLAKHLPETNMLRVGFVGVSWRLPVWPFDGYPTFANPPRHDMEVWEARVVLDNGDEFALSARSYERLFGPPANCREATDAVRREGHAERHRDRSLELVKALWAYEEEGVRRRTRNIRVYHARYGLDPLHRKPLDSRLMHEFPLGLIGTSKAKSGDQGTTRAGSLEKSSRLVSPLVESRRSAVVRST